MTRSEHIKALLSEYAQRKGEQEAAQQERIDHAYALDPEIENLRTKNVSMAIGAMRRLMQPQSPEASRAIAESVKQQGLKNNQELRARLTKLGLSADYIDFQYTCKKCNDTGYVGDAPAKFCDCFLSALSRRQHEDGSMAGVDKENFDRFDPYFIPDEKLENSNHTQRMQLVAAKNMCESYANSYPGTGKQNILLMGEGGLGKTFLLNCIFARVVDRGHNAIRITSYRMFEAMRKQHIGNKPDFDDYTSLINVPLLFIDDLGTEPIMRNITIEYLFMLLNERIAMNRHTVIATNLRPTQIKERYGERVASRLLDRSRCATVMLRGKDLRTQ